MQKLVGSNHTLGIIKQGDSSSEFILCFGTFKLSVDLTVIETYNGFGIYLASLSYNDLWNSRYFSTQVYINGDEEIVLRSLVF